MRLSIDIIKETKVFSVTSNYRKKKKEKLENLQRTRRDFVSSRTPPGNLGFSALQASSLPSSFFPRARTILLTVELLLCVMETIGSPITSSPNLQMILAAGELPQVSHLAAIGRPAYNSSSLKMIFTTAGLTEVTTKKSMGKDRWV